MKMKIIAISDTHGCHRQLQLPEGDIILHAGDVCDRGNKDHVLDFIDWYQQLPYQYKIMIGGNHDIDLSTQQSLLSNLPKEIIYLDEKGIQISDISIWGMPYARNAD